MVVLVLQISKRVGSRRVMSELSSWPLGWSEQWERVSGLPMDLPGWWVRVKLRWDR